MVALAPVAVLDAPSNLGLRPPGKGLVPGCYKLPWALRGRGLLERIGAMDAQSVVPPRYAPTWKKGEGDRNAVALAQYSRRLADRVESLVREGQRLLVLGGDCSILVGETLALRRLGRYGLMFLDAHSDFRHPGLAPPIVSAAGEDLAIVTGRGDARLVDLEGRRPYVRDEDVHLVGVRDSDPAHPQLGRLGIHATTAVELGRIGADAAASRALATVDRSARGFWVHFDVDVVDASEISAVDSPAGPGPSLALLGRFLRRVVAAPGFVGMDLTIYDPDLDPDGTEAQRLVDCLAFAFPRSA